MTFWKKTAYQLVNANKFINLIDTLKYFIQVGHNYVGSPSFHIIRLFFQKTKTRHSAELVGLPACDSSKVCSSVQLPPNHLKSR
jgi:hypothetical protein